jgi:hypothetical protein
VRLPSTSLTWIARVAAGAWLALGAGCMQPGPYDPARVGPFYSPTNFAAEPTLGGLRRVVVLPVAGGTLAPSEAMAALDPVFVAALQQENRFEVVTLSREDCLRRFHAEALSSAGALPHDLLPTLRRDFAADAVLFIDLTAYSAYRPLAIGLRAKLATLDGTRILWTFDNVFSAADPAVANAARQHFIGADRAGIPADFTPSVLQSPGRFASYAATAMFATLPPVVLPPPPQTRNVEARGR